MRNLISILAILLLFPSCSDYLDKMPDDKVSEKDVYSRFDKVDQLVTDLYSGAKSANKPLIYFNHFGTATITDEGTGSSHEAAIPRQFQVGNWGPSVGMPDRSSTGQYWWGLYERVRKANLILAGVKKYNTPDNPQQGREGDITRRVGETYFLRGYLHFLLLRAYGEVPYVLTALNPDDDMTGFDQLSAHKVVEMICADADSAYARVDAFNGGQDFGRVDKGACLGLKAMARWIAATPMYNSDGKFPNDTRIYKAEYGYKAERWNAAKDAAKAVLECKDNNGAPRYQLYSKFDANDFGDLNNNNTNNSKVQKRLWQMFFDMDAIQQEWVWVVT
ncbi:MAG: RagB/SusD family nutrient uptake outer membrane protein, partial [Bacteroidales bacterium]